MREVKYNFPSSAFEDLIDNDYETINEGLIRKYGSPLGYSNGDCYIFIGGALESVTFHLALIQFIDGFGDLQDYDEWDVDTGDYNKRSLLHWGPRSMRSRSCRFPLVIL